MTDPQFFDLTFPVAGVDQQAAVLGQPAFTTTTGVNVRACDPRTRRLRGGSRSGLSRFIDAIPGGTASVIQHLAVVAYTSNDGLPEDTELVDAVADPPPSFDPGEGRPEPPPPASPPPTAYPDDWVVDPHDPDRYNPPGGTGTDLDPDDTTNPPLSPPGGGGESGWVYRQSDIESATIGVPGGGGTPTVGLSFGSAVEDNQLLVVGVFAPEGDISDGGVFGTTLTSVGVTDTLGNTWTEAASVSRENARTPDPPFLHRVKYHLKLFYTRTNGGTCDITVTLTYSNSYSGAISHGVTAVAVEYTGLENASPFEGSADDSFSAAPGSDGPVTVTAGACPVGGTTRLAVGFMAFFGTYEDGDPDGTITDGFTLRRQSSSFSATSGSWVVWIDDTSTGVASEPSVVSPAFTAGSVLDPDIAHVSWLAVNGAFRYGN